MANSLLLTDIGQLVCATGPAGAGEQSLGLASRQAVLSEDGIILRVGNVEEGWVDRARATATVVSAEGSCVIPGFVDSHTHLIHGGDRLAEFIARMSGEPYHAGGITKTVALTRDASDDELRHDLGLRVRESLEAGTTTIEVKTGYGLSVEQEVRLARIAHEYTDQVTFLGAHVVPAEWQGDPDGYLDLVTTEMLEAVVPYCRFVDVFYEHGACDADQARRVLAAGAARGLIPTIHASQLSAGQGAAIAREFSAASLSHGTFLTEEDWDLLADTDTVVTLLPGTEFATRQPYPDAAAMMARGVTVTLASNCNPGSGYSSSMPLMIALAVREMGMSPADALWSATKGGAQALQLSDRGVIAPGMRADLVQLRAPHYGYLAYRPGVSLIRRVIRAGVVEVENAW